MSRDPNRARLLPCGDLHPTPCVCCRRCPTHCRCPVFHPSAAKIATEAPTAPVTPLEALPAARQLFEGWARGPRVGKTAEAERIVQEWLDAGPPVQVRAEEIPGGTIYFLDQPAAPPALQPVQVIYEESTDVSGALCEQMEGLGLETVFYPGGGTLKPGRDWMAPYLGRFRRDWRGQGR